ncbi:Hpt domain-containing protein [Fontivita pretiosa]|uniref:Hpt domain-containing protein n=1 Tax=Fontivita pretiosa TaxID=2989684 RepID=UPI003D17F45C
MNDPGRPCDHELRHDTAEAPLDVDRLLQQCVGSAAIVLRVLDRFAVQLNADREAIRAAVSAADAAAVARTAHSLKGAAGAVAADRLHAVAALLETHARSGELQAVARELDALIAEIERCAAYLPAARRAASAAGSRQVGDCQQRNQRCGS